MTHPLKHAVRFVVLLGAAGLIAALSIPSGSGTTPYFTALSDVTATAAFAAPPACENKACKDTSTDKVTCFKSPGTRCGKIPGGARCVTDAC